jgi:hypothetical protein
MVHADRTAVLACENADGDVVLSKKLPFTPARVTFKAARFGRKLLDRAPPDLHE